MSAQSFDVAATVGVRVVRLPTAARRKVQQRWNKGTRALAKPMREQWPGKYRRPGQPEEIETVPLVQTPELAFALAIFGALPVDRQEEAKSLLRQMKERSRSGEAQAILDLFTLGRMALD